MDHVGYNLCNVLAPFLASPALQAPAADVILVGSFLIGKASKLEGPNFAVDDRTGTQARTQTQEEHLSTLIGAEGLHSSVVHYSNRTSEGTGKIKPNPPLG